MAKKKVPVGVWRTTTRKIKGAKRLVEVKKLANGKEKIRVVNPKTKKGKKATSRASKSPKLSMISKIEAAKSFDSRSEMAKATDRSKRSKKTLKNATAAWMKDPTHSDVEGIDTKRY